MDDLDRVVSSTLRRIREEQGITQAELAERLDSSRTVVSRVERGERPLELGEFYAWAQALGMDYNELFEQISKEVLTAANAA